MQRFKVVESYLHKAAKAVVVEWLRAAAQEAGDGAEWFKLAPVHCRPNRGAPGFGIWPEWPVAGSLGLTELWDEFWPDSEPRRETGTAPPTPEQLIAAGTRPQCVIDVGVIHKGRLGCAVEIVHKHPTPAWKVALLEAADVPLVEVDALAVLQKIERPNGLPLYRRQPEWVPQLLKAQQPIVPRFKPGHDVLAGWRAYRAKRNAE